MKPVLQNCLLFLAISTILLCAGCATDPAVLAGRKLDGDAIAAKTWYSPPQIFNNLNNSFESDSSCKFRPDGTGVVSSRRFGYCKPGAKNGSTIGCGAYTEVVSWPISWAPLGDGKLRVRGTGGPTSTGPGWKTPGLPPLALRYAKLSGNVLAFHFTSGTKEENQSVDPNDPRLNPNQSEIKSRLADWAAKGPKLIAETEAKFQAQQAALQQQRRTDAIIGSAILNNQLNPYTTPYIPH